MKNILYLSYDGMTDPLGQSQVLPYVTGLSGYGYSFTILSFEKKERYASGREQVEKLCAQYRIDWRPLPFSTRPAVISKLWDAYRMKSAAMRLHDEKNFSLVHCRSYISAAAGLQLKRRRGVKYLFDMRGFWVDERVDGGLWNLRQPFYRMAYRYYKNRERQYVCEADHIISLTHAAVEEMKKWSTFSDLPVTVIPTSTDFDVFVPATAAEKQASRTALGIPNGSLVVSYLGSFGTWYLMDDMLRFFAAVKKKFPDALFLNITPDAATPLHQHARAYGIAPADILIRSASRLEVRTFLSAADVGIMFIKDAYSKIASSPTKLGEQLAMGIPVVCNPIGDMTEILKLTEGGIAVELNDASFERAVTQIPSLLSRDKDQLRKRAQSYYDLNIAVQRYAGVYAQLLS